MNHRAPSRSRSGPSATLAILALAIVAGAMLGQAKPDHSHRPSGLASSSQTIAKADAGLDDVPPPGLYPALVAAFQRDAPDEYAVTVTGGNGHDTIQASNPAHGLLTRFTADGALVTPGAFADQTHLLRGGWTWGLDLIWFGYTGALLSMPRLQPNVAAANRVEYRYGDYIDADVGLVEWYLNGPLGLEHGFTVDHRPGESNGALLEFELAVPGDLTGGLENDGQGIAFAGPDGTHVVYYTGLYAYDALGVRLPARLALRERGFAIEVDDSDAIYPIVVDPFVQLAKLTATDGAGGDDFGGAADIDNGTIVVGAVNDDGSGSAYVFVGSEGTWTQQAKLNANDGASGDRFGSSVAVSGDTIVVGATRDDAAGLLSGSAYVFARSGTTWSQQAKLTGGDTTTDDQFGESVTVSGDIIVVGVSLDDHVAGGGNAGSAYVFERDLGGAGNWGQRKKLIDINGDPNENFGSAVSLNGNTLAIGAPGHDGSKGAAYVFDRNLGGTDNWGQRKILLASVRTANDKFGAAVGVDGDTVAVGAPQDDGTGTAYVFDRNLGGADAWGQRAKLTAGDAATDDNFGVAVGIDADRVLVGAHLDDDKGAGSGSVYVFERDSGGTDVWGQKTKLTAVDGAASDEFGKALAIDKSVAAIGSHLDDDNGGASGSAYVFMPSADLSLAKSGSPNLTVGLNQTLTYTLTVNNLGPDDATDVVVTDTLPSLVTFVSAAAGCTESGGTVTCNIAKVAAGSQTAVTVQVTADGPVGSVISNSASVTANEVDSNSVNNTSSPLTTKVPGVSLPGLVVIFGLLTGAVYWRLRRTGRPARA